MKSQVGWYWKTQSRTDSSGFTLIEVLIAGVILAASMTALSRLSLASVAVSKKQLTRTSIEAVITADIQILQKADSEFRYGVGGATAQDCINPAQALASHLNSRQDLSFQHPEITRTIPTNMNGDTLTITYKLLSPETSIANEYRMIEMNPDFHARCTS
ncbi:type IV pilus modification PilV family protein [Synechococcus sp. MIT S9503]|uniref:type IV pilus modification PilV family protein n=1 Tax=Synechococcus sp. MIT S9503 TaxID=3082547 RepID=UPI0039A46D1B